MALRNARLAYLPVAKLLNKRRALKGLAWVSQSLDQGSIGRFKPLRRGFEGLQEDEGSKLC